jgi:dihydrofolate synthase/folylpolyglutamate synthase
MLNTKDVGGYLRPLADVADSLTAVPIPGEANTLPAADTAAVARTVGFDAGTADSVGAALASIAAHSPDARILICGSLYLAGRVLQQNG